MWCLKGMAVLDFYEAICDSKKSNNTLESKLRLGDKLNIRELSTLNSLCFSQVKVEMRTVFVPLVQLVEPSAHNRVVQGSRPWWNTIKTHTAIFIEIVC